MMGVAFIYVCGILTPLVIKAAYNKGVRDGEHRKH